MVIDVRAVNGYDSAGVGSLKSAVIVSFYISLPLGLHFPLEYLTPIFISNIEPFSSGLGGFLSCLDAEFSSLSSVSKCGHTVIITVNTCLLKTECLNHPF